MVLLESGSRGDGSLLPVEVSLQVEFFLGGVAEEYRCVDDALKLIDHRFEFIPREGRKELQRILLRRLHLPEDGEDHADREESDCYDDDYRGLKHGLHGIR